MNIEDRVKLTSISDGCATIALSQDIDSAMSDDFLNTVISILNEHDCDIVFDCTDLFFVDSTTLGVMVKIYKEAKARGKKVIVKI